jgi:hypothetical protein
MDTIYFSMLKNLLINGLIFCIVLTLSLSIAEGAWRMFLTDGDIKRMYHPELQRINPPNTEWTVHTKEFVTTMRTNSDGFRGEELQTPGQEDALRILIIGDSFVEAKQVPEEDRFVERIEEQLKAQLHQDVIVRALGIGGADPAQEIFFYRHLGRSFKPNIVIQVLYPENDLLGTKGPYTLQEKGGAIELTDIYIPQKKSCNWKCQILTHSHIARKTYQLLRRWNTDPTNVRVLGESIWHTQKGHNQIQNERRLDILNAFVQTLQKDVQNDQGQFIVTLLPGFFEIHPEWRKEIQQKHPHIEWLDPSLLLDRIKNTLEKNSIAVLDVRPEFKEHAKDTQLYFRHDPHLNQEGHRIVAKELTKAILDRIIRP